MFRVSNPTPIFLFEHFQNRDFLILFSEHVVSHLLDKIKCR